MNAWEMLALQNATRQPANPGASVNPSSAAYGDYLNQLAYPGLYPSNPPQELPRTTASNPSGNSSALDELGKAMASSANAQGGALTQEQIMRLVLNDPTRKMAVREIEEAIPLQKEGIKNQLELAKIYAGTPAQLDLSPLMALTDSITGSKLSAGYNKPQAIQERISGTSALSKGADEERQKLITSLTQLAGQSANEKLAAALYGKSGTQDRFNEKNLLQKEEVIRKDLNDSVLKPLSEREAQWGLIDQAFASGDYQTVGATLAQFARGVSGEKGVLTDQDIYRIMPRNVYGDASKIRAYFSETPSDKLPADYLEKLKSLLATARENTQRVYGGLLKDKRSVYSSSQSYKDLFSEGGSGDLMFKQVESKFQGGDKRRRLEELRAKKAAGTLQK